MLRFRRGRLRRLVMRSLFLLRNTDFSRCSFVRVSCLSCVFTNGSVGRLQFSNRMLLGLRSRVLFFVMLCHGRSSFRIRRLAAPAPPPS